MLRVLIVEDSGLFRKVFRETLHARFPTFAIDEASNGKEAMNQIEKHSPDFIFVDIHLSGENGLELTREKKTRYPDLVAIILTSYDLPEYREAALQYKADHFLPKDSFLKLFHSIFVNRHLTPDASNLKDPF